MYRKCLENRLTCLDQHYKCHLCHVIMVKQNGFEDIEEHLQTDNHLEKLQKIDKNQRKKESEQLLKMSEQQLKEIVESLIVFDKNSLMSNCIVCKCQINGKKNTYQHIKGSSHKKEWVENIERHRKVRGKLEKKMNKVSSDVLTAAKTAIDNKFTTATAATKKSVKFAIPADQSDSNNMENIENHRNIRENKMKKVSFDELTVANAATNKNFTIDKATADRSVKVQAAISGAQSDSNNIIYNKNTNTHYCNICKIDIAATYANVSQHIDGLLHQALKSTLENSNSSLNLDYIFFNEKLNSYYCMLCVCQIGNIFNVSQHIHGFSHQDKLKPKIAKNIKIVDGETQGILAPIDLTSQKVLLNLKEADNKSKDQVLKKIDHQFLAPKAPQSQKVPVVLKEADKKNKGQVLKKIHYKSQFTEVCYCKSCNTYFKKPISLKCHVLLHLCKELDSLKNFDLITCQFEPNNIVQLTCWLCNSLVCKVNMLNADQELEKHLKTPEHVNRLRCSKKSTNDLLTSTMNEQISNINLENVKFSSQKDIAFELLCNICDVSVPLNNEQEHASGKKHNEKMFEAGITYTNTVKRTELNLDKYFKCYRCFICKKSFFEISNLLEHFKTNEHQWKIIALNMINKCPYIKFISTGTKIQCSLCKVKLCDFTSTIAHILGRRHKEVLQLPVDNSNSQESLKSAQLAQVTVELDRLSLTSETTSRKLRNDTNSNKNKNTPIIKLDKLHKVEIVSKLEASTEELHQLGFSNENILPPKLKSVTENKLDNLISLEFNNAEARRLPSLAKKKIPRTPTIGNIKKSFATIVMESGKDYIRYCIDPGLQNIYNVNEDKISLMKLGIDLTYPNNSDIICFPCGQQFPDDVQGFFEHLQSHAHQNQMCDLLIDDKEFEDIPEQFSHLRLAKLYMHMLDDGVQCHACNIQLKDDDEIIRQHSKELVHQEKSQLWKQQSEKVFNQYMVIYRDIWYYAEVFFCEICKKKYEYEIDFVKHLQGTEHMKNKLKCKGVALTFDLCPSCITYWFGKTDSYEIHCKSQFHKRFAKNKDFMVPNLTVNASEFLDNIDENIDLLESESDKVMLERHLEKSLLDAVIETVKPVYPHAKAYIFGSRLSNLGFPSSDVDVFLDCENVYYSSSTQKQSQQYIKSVKSYFESTPSIWIVDDILLDARVPIMKLRHIPTNLKCDISFINGLSVEKSQLIGLYNFAFPVCRKLILFMKKWLTLCRLFGSDNITTFAISWYVIFYLQVQRILPTVHELLQLKKESKIVDGWQCGFVEIFSANNSDRSFKEHLKGFFIYFAGFDYQKSVICPYLGKPIYKNMFTYENADQLPVEMDIYKKRLQNNAVEIFRFDSPMCIQDPIDLAQNMTKAVKKQQLRCFRQYCILSAEKC